MSAGSDLGLAVLAFVAVVGPLIFFHEVGHFLAARINKIKVDEFGIGLPPRMVKLFEHQGTVFTLNWLPLGGFVRPAGEDDPAVPGGLAASPRLARLSVLGAGPGANILLAFILYVGMFMIGAPEELPGARVQQVVPGAPAAEAGLLAGDIILSADETEITRTPVLTDYIRSHLGQPILLTVRRGDVTMQISVSPRLEWPENQGPTGIVIEPISHIRQFTIIEAIPLAGMQFVERLSIFTQIPAIIREINAGTLPASTMRPLSVVGISRLGGQFIDSSFEEQAAWPILQFAGTISLLLGITNLLPIPALDGGRILFVLVEAIRGKRLDPRREGMIHYVGFAILLTAMVVFVFLDFVDPVVLR